MTTKQKLVMSDYVDTKPTTVAGAVTLGLFVAGAATHPAMAAQALLTVDDLAQHLSDEEWDRAVANAATALDAFRSAITHAVRAATDPHSIQ